MIGQHFDNIWIYTKDITNKFSADNRLDYGISKDLVADAIRDFGVKLYANNFSIDDLRLVSYTDGFEYHSLTQKANIIFELDGFYYYIFDEVDKLFDIISMPQYLQEEWFHNNKKVLTEEFTKIELDKQLVIERSINPETLSKNISELKCILREFRIDKII